MVSDGSVLVQATGGHISQLEGFHGYLICNAISGSGSSLTSSRKSFSHFLITSLGWGGSSYAYTDTLVTGLQFNLYINATTRPCQTVILKEQDDVILPSPYLIEIACTPANIDTFGETNNESVVQYYVLFCMKHNVCNKKSVDL